MTQAGRVYRAAKPRSNLLEFPYNQRLPMRTRFVGTFDNGLGLFSIPTTQDFGVCLYDEVNILWSITNDFFLGIIPMRAILAVKAHVGTPGYVLSLLVTDFLGGAVLDTWEVGQSFPPFNKDAWPFIVVPDSTIASGTFGTGGTRWVSGLTYAEEP